MKKLPPLPEPQAFRPGFQLFDLPLIKWVCLSCKSRMLGTCSKAPNRGACRTCGSRSLLDCNTAPLVATLTLETICRMPN